MGRDQKIAKHLELQGYAKNMNDMSVEVKAVGEKSVLEEFVQLIFKNPGRAEIINVEIFYSSSSTEYISFLIY
jgi:acylphosphatase